MGRWTMKYLGLPLGGNPRPRALKFWDPVVEKVETRLQNWKEAFLSRGGRLILIQAVLGSIAIYYMSLFRIPCGSKLEKLMRSCLWEGIKGGEERSPSKVGDDGHK